MATQRKSAASGPAGGARVRDALLWPIRWTAQKASLLLAEKRGMDGFILYDATGQGRADELLDRLASGLALLAELDRRRYRRLRRDIPNLLVTAGGVTDYYPPTRTGMIPARILEGWPEATVAVELVQLAARARMANTLRGFRFDRTNNERAMRRAVREQIAFASRLDPERFSGMDAMHRYLSEALEQYS